MSRSQVLAASYAALADGLAQLLTPLGEVVLHDIERDEVAYVAGALSPREIGDPSNLRELGPGNDGKAIGPYEKINWDGRRIRSLSVALPGDVPLMLCINVDVSHFEAMRGLLDTFLRSPSQSTVDDAEPLLRADWHETLNRFIAAWASERGLDVRTLGRVDRQALIQAIQRSGGFDGRRSVPYVANLLGVSRATVYSQLAELKEGGEEA
ncbi:helix-turn-helix transcriptional regulator [Stenotrophomonas maltophilia]|uniref:helix-turn-helix transcriptional regulator n=1 Tax=Stenotrophomonas maltophilia TaxID=40324 RepID=UPI001559B2F4|nr:PAS domain-containing protein [Stenotrophomonas maltophilia]